ncbi:MAG: hypothetical protein EXX96DRAFT_561119 [Benjaminiella poitrasii]|nr:MAG: hypothetical protein EXX96DRAFT_561119 [Benjaminiella poitrasii]
MSTVNRNYKVIYDPELDPNQTKQNKYPVLKYQTEQEDKPTDPRSPQKSEYHRRLLNIVQYEKSPILPSKEQDNNKRVILVSNILPNITESQIVLVLSVYGTINRIEMIENADNGDPATCNARITFNDRTSAIRALSNGNGKRTIISHSMKLEWDPKVASHDRLYIQHSPSLDSNQRKRARWKSSTNNISQKRLDDQIMERRELIIHSPSPIPHNHEKQNIEQEQSTSSLPNTVINDVNPIATKLVVVNELADTLLTDIKRRVTAPYVHSFYRKSAKEATTSPSLSNCQGNNKTVNEQSNTDTSVFTKQVGLSSSVSSPSLLAYKFSPNFRSAGTSNTKTLSSLNVGKENQDSARTIDDNFNSLLLRRLALEQQSLNSRQSRKNEDMKLKGNISIKNNKRAQSNDYSNLPAATSTKAKPIIKQRKIIVYPQKKKASVSDRITNNSEGEVYIEIDGKEDYNDEETIDIERLSSSSDKMDVDYDEATLERILQTIEKSDSEKEETEEDKKTNLITLYKEWDPFYQAKDAEDLAYLQIAIIEKLEPIPTSAVHDAFETLKKEGTNMSQSARTKGYYKIPLRKAPIKPAHITYSTSLERTFARFNRRLFAGMMLHSKEADLLKFKQYQTQKKPSLKLQRSHIHGWGLHTEDHVNANDIVVEYVGEVISHQVAEKRGRRYARCGVGGSYLFRVDDETVIDTTRKGNIARFANHCCTPNCSVKVMIIDKQKRVVIYAIRDIESGEEITYDYRYSIEADVFQCLCGSKFCKGM